MIDIVDTTQKIRDQIQRTRNEFLLKNIYEVNVAEVYWISPMTKSLENRMAAFSNYNDATEWIGQICNNLKKYDCELVGYINGEVYK